MLNATQLRPPSRAHATKSRNVLVVFATELGAMGYVESPSGIVQIVIGFERLADAHAQLTADFTELEEREHGDLADLLERYARGEMVLFDDVTIDARDLSPFRKTVSDQCRKIPYGTKVTYSELAAKAGSPRAVRAVGSIMARNRWPLVVPCHRVVRTNGQMGGFSAPQGIEFKKRLLALEGRHRRP